MPRIAKALYAAPVKRERHPDGALDVGRIVEEARSAAEFHGLFAERADLVALVQQRVRRSGFSLPDAAIRESLAEC